MAIDEAPREGFDRRVPELRAERMSRELARISKRLTIVLLLVALPYLIALLAVIAAIASGADVKFDVS